MMTNELFIKIVGAIITILVALITTFVIPWLKAKIDGEQTEKLAYYINMACRCADQLFTTEQWELKKQYVTAYITNLVNTTFKLTLTEDDINILIEGAVNQLHKG